MGIKNLFKVISDNAPSAIKITDFQALSGRKIAIDASMSLYQFLIAVRQTDGLQLSSDTGETTSHLIGIFYRTIRMIEQGLKPVYVFDGKPPELKSNELQKRSDAREKAEKAKAEAVETGTAEEVQKYERRLVTVTREQNEEAKRLLRLMGVPYVEAPGEAEAQCAAMARSNKVYAAASEDMDTLTFNAPVMLRHLTAGDQKKQPVTEINLNAVLEGLNMSLSQFVDLCMLLGCDYCDPIRGMGPSTAFKLITEFKSIEKIKEVLISRGGKLQIPDDWPYKKVRDSFLNPSVNSDDNISLKWTEPDVDGLIQYLVKEKGFSEDRVRLGAAKLAKGTSTASQGRLTDFFKVQKRKKDTAENRSSKLIKIKK